MMTKPTSRVPLDELLTQADQAKYPAAVQDWLTQLVIAFDAEAAAVWRWDRQQLVQWAFASGVRLLPEVKTAFIQATGVAKLSQTGLGCVQAAIRCAPVIAHQQGVLAGSASWLDRFGAASSLATPLNHDGDLLGVLAIATRDRLDEHHTYWQQLQQLAARLAQAWAWPVGSGSAAESTGT